MLKKIFRRGCLRRFVINMGYLLIAIGMVFFIGIAQHFIETMDVEKVKFLVPVMVLGLAIFHAKVLVKLLED